jgi:hypothetical protein
MRFTVTVFAADGDTAVEGEVVDFDECEEMGTVHVPGATQADAEGLAYGCIGSGPGWHPVFKTVRIPSFFFMEQFNLDDGRSVRFVYDHEIERLIVADLQVNGSWVPAPPEDVVALRADPKCRDIIWAPEKYPAATEVMARENLPAWATARLTA